MKTGFDMKKYYKLQIEEINKRIDMFGEKLYFEIGGKLFDDNHASRVLPGFEPDAKIRILTKMKEKTEIIFCISANDIASNKKRSDNELPYSADVLRQIDQFRKVGLLVSSVVITLFDEQKDALNFKKMLERRGETVYLHRKTKGYPTDVDTIVSEDGYGKNPYIKTSRPLVVVTAPGPCSGKLGTCLSQLYHENKNGVKAGYSKLETFPIWNLSLAHPVNIAYEAATLDLKDVNMIDPFHFYAFGETVINYNRDIEQFPLLKRIFQKIGGMGTVFRSPTEMGVNNAGNSIIDDEICKQAARQEILRRYLDCLVDAKNGKVDYAMVERAKQLVDNVGIAEIDRPVIQAARDKHEKTGLPVVAIELENGKIVTGKETKETTEACSAVLNAIKELAGIHDSIKLIDPSRVKPASKMKSDVFDDVSGRLGLRDALLLLSIDKNSNESIEKALEKLPELKGCEAHSSCEMNASDRKILKKLRLNITQDPVFASKELFTN